ncbi:dipeptide epimerase [Sphingopyxis sp. JAI128]|uniref:dipeptide epimerase n=1 Tax=Sphingopyxis sp. JAI128 TaxID=2723066 RepID=UPI00161E0814|nr:dipeptide epimerase [Sphingopyxis sp. JAI128]MBB6428155.1 L-alanine-DL-glutamate epimerase-like enolase superfamily enzyme [Sphingopyxis sp. JAI128]
MEIDVLIETWPLIRPFRITGHVYEDIEVVVVMLRDGEHVGRGEAAGVDYLGETPRQIFEQVAALRETFARGIDRTALQSILPPGGARNALDCALWDIESSQKGFPAWHRAGVETPLPRITTWTIGAEAPDAVHERAQSYADALALKLKLTGDGLDAERIRALRSARPDVWLGVDGNQGFSRASLEALMPVLVEQRVALFEQPLPMTCDQDLDTLYSPIPLAADESVQDLSSIERLSPAYSIINIKLDKCGGLTEALAMVEATRARGMGVMVGNMLGTSLAMAPAFIVGQFCDVVDLDGPVLLRNDRAPGAVFDKGTIFCPDGLWGGTQMARQPLDHHN